MIVKALPILKFYDVMIYKALPPDIHVHVYSFLLGMEREKLEAKSLSKLAMW